ENRWCMWQLELPQQWKKGGERWTELHLTTPGPTGKDISPSEEKWKMAQHQARQLREYGHKPNQNIRCAPLRGKVNAKGSRWPPFCWTWCSVGGSSSGRRGEHLSN
ncbi:hypothetical protein NDU88_007012, partial [Pleurodeles waltl]